MINVRQALFVLLALAAFGCEAAPVPAHLPDKELEFLPKQRIHSIVEIDNGSYVISFSRSARGFAIDPTRDTAAQQMVRLAGEQIRWAHAFRDELYVTVAEPDDEPRKDGKRLGNLPRIARIARTPDPRATGR